MKNKNQTKENWEKDRQKFIDALIWCSGSDDFQVGGKARKGWALKNLQPLEKIVNIKKKNHYI